jgi:hypothetical protein
VIVRRIRRVHCIVEVFLEHCALVGWVPLRHQDGHRVGWAFVVAGHGVETSSLKTGLRELALVQCTKCARMAGSKSGGQSACEWVATILLLLLWLNEDALVLLCRCVCVGLTEETSCLLLLRLLLLLLLLRLTENTGACV